MATLEGILILTSIVGLIAGVSYTGLLCFAYFSDPYRRDTMLFTLWIFVSLCITVQSAIVLFFFI